MNKGRVVSINDRRVNEAVDAMMSVLRPLPKEQAIRILIAVYLLDVDNNLSTVLSFIKDAMKK
jgi:hypothetical protein